MNGIMLENMFAKLSTETIDFLNCDGLTDILTTLSTIENIVPKHEDIFRAFELCPIEKTRIVLIGQDPFPTTIGDIPVANGLSFSSEKLQPSTRNIFKALLHSKLIDTIPNHGDLSSWASQGILLLNSILTTIANTSASHVQLWLPYSRLLIEKLKARNVIFITFGEYARKLVNSPDALFWGHPSPLNRANTKENPARFELCDVFIKVNIALRLRNEDPINWNTVNLRAIVEIRAEIRDDPNNEKLYIFTDGAAKSNGKANCRASSAYYITDRKDINIESADIVKNVDLGEVYKSSNQRGELTAILTAMQRLETMNNKLPVEIVSDSEYSIKCISVWAKSWYAKNNIAGKKNLDIIKPALDLYLRLKATQVITFKHIRSHKSAPANSASIEWFYWNGNDRADKLCTEVLNRA
jgi:uracil-DNA glycosylase